MEKTGGEKNKNRNKQLRNMYAYNVNSAKCDGQAMLEIKIGSLSGAHGVSLRALRGGVGSEGEPEGDTVSGKGGRHPIHGSRQSRGLSGLVWSGLVRLVIALLAIQISQQLFYEMFFNLPPTLRL